MHAPLLVESLESREVPASMDALPILPEYDLAIAENVRAIYQRGIAQGNRADAMIKVGDSITAYTGSVLALGSPLAAQTISTYHPELLDTYQRYSAPVAGGNSFTRNNLTARSGYHAREALANLATELTVLRPSVAIVQIGTNDLGTPQSVYRSQLTQIINTLIGNGTVPILTVLPTAYNLFNGGSYEPYLTPINDFITDLAEDYNLPIWNLRKALQALPGAGLGDGVHPSEAPTTGADLSPTGVQFGYNLRNLTMLQALDGLWDILARPALPQFVESPWQPLAAGTDYTAVSLEDSAVVLVLNPAGDVVNTVATFGVGGDASLGDVNGDGVPDLVMSGGPGAGPIVQARDGVTGSILWQFFVYEDSFRGGVQVALGNLDGDALADVVVSPTSGGGPLVRAFRGSDQSEISAFFAYEPTFRGGTQIAMADTTGDGIAEIVTGAGAGGAPVVKVFAANGADVDAFFAYEESLRSGVFISTGDLNGDGMAEILTGPGQDGARVQAFGLQNREPLLNAFLDDPALGQGARVEFIAGPSPQIWVSSGRDNTIKRWSLPQLEALADLTIPMEFGQQLLL